MKRQKHFWILVLAVIAFITLDIVYAATELVRINGTVITLEDFNKKYQETQRLFQMRTPSKKDVLEELIKREIGIQEAKKEGLDRDSDIVDRMNTVLYQALLEKKLSKKIEDIRITDAETEKYYSNNPEIRTSHIFIAVPPSTSREDDNHAKEKMSKIQAELKKGKSFAEVAQNFSEGPAAPMGGDIGYQTKDLLDPVYYSTAIKQKICSTCFSGIVKTQFGYHIIRLTAVRSWKEADHAMVKRMLFLERRARLMEEFMTSLRKNATVSIKSDLIK